MWLPEVLTWLELDSVALEQLLIAYGSPAAIAADAEHAARQMQRWGGHFLKPDKIERVIASAGTTLGQPCLEAERRYGQALASELQHSRSHGQDAKQQLQAEVGADHGLNEMTKTIGSITTAVLIGAHCDPRHYANAHSYVKALGLNLIETSSGKVKGPLKLSKRGSSMARQYLYLAALRLIQRDPVIRAWYQSKAQPHAKIKTVIALVRKLAKALWYIARGAPFQAEKLVTLVATSG